MKNDKYSVLRRARARILADTQSAKANVKRRKEVIIHLATHPLPYFIIIVALTFICEALKTS
jgi:hypothetical protein